MRTLDCLANQGIKLATYSPYSVDLSACNFCPFGKLKLRLRVRRLINDIETITAFQDAIGGIDKEAWKSCFKD